MKLNIMKVLQIRNFVSRWRWVVNLKPTTLFLQPNSPPYTTKNRLDGLHIRSGGWGEEKISFPFVSIRALIPESHISYSGHYAGWIIVSPSMTNNTLVTMQAEI